MENIIEKITATAVSLLTEIDQRIRQQRKLYKITANAVLNAAGISRVTLHRIEEGEPSVSIGAYFIVLSTLNLRLNVVGADHVAAESKTARVGRLPACIYLADYP